MRFGLSVLLEENGVVSCKFNMVFSWDSVMMVDDICIFCSIRFNEVVVGLFDGLIKNIGWVLGYKVNFVMDYIVEWSFWFIGM